MSVTWTPAGEYEDIRYELSGDGIAKITIDRPEVRNAFRPETVIELMEAFERAREDTEVGAIILTGEGERAFCVGSDLKERAKINRDDHPPTGFAGITKRFDLFKPVVAAVNGLALGGGMEILAACDLAVAAEHAEFGLPEPRVGLAALGGGALQRLARQLNQRLGPRRGERTHAFAQPGSHHHRGPRNIRDDVGTKL